MVTAAQVRLLRQKRMDGKTQAAAAAAAGMSVRSARAWEHGPLPSQSKKDRYWRTRPDPFQEVWEPDVLPLLVADRQGRLQAKTILEELKGKHPESFDDSQLRSLQRRVRDWRALSGPPKEVYWSTSSSNTSPPGKRPSTSRTRRRSRSRFAACSSRTCSSACA